jgi:hypothetical protein
MLAAGILVSARTVAQAEEPIRVYIFAGQSNMVGKDALASDLPSVAPAALIPSPSVWFWGPVTDFPVAWGPLQAPTEIVQARRHQGFGPEIGAGPKLARMHPDSTIAIVKFAESGTTLYKDWDPGRPDGLYRRMITRVRSAVANLRLTKDAPVRIAGFFWMQGEGDSDSLTQARAYETNLSAFVRAVRRDLRAPRLPFVLGRIGDLRLESSAHFQYSGVVRKGQADVARTVPNTYMVSTDGLERAPASRIHLSSLGTYELGRRFVKSSYPL